MRFPRGSLLRLAAGIIAANLAGATAFGAVAGGLYLVVQLPPQFAGLTQLFGLAVAFPSIFVVPVGMGFFAAYFWRPLNLGVLALFALASVITAVGALGAYLVFHEGRVCLVIGSPIAFILIFSAC